MWARRSLLLWSFEAALLVEALSLTADAHGSLDGPAGFVPAGLICFLAVAVMLTAGAIRRRRRLCYTLAPAAQFIQMRGRRVTQCVTAHGTPTLELNVFRATAGRLRNVAVWRNRYACGASPRSSMDRTSAS